MVSSYPKQTVMLKLPSDLNIEITNIAYDTIQLHTQRRISRPKMGVHISIYGNLKNKWPGRISKITNVRNTKKSLSMPLYSRGNRTGVPRGFFFSTCLKSKFYFFCVIEHLCLYWISSHFKYIGCFRETQMTMSSSIGQVQ